jgi:hypothetical protein
MSIGLVISGATAFISASNKGISDFVLGDKGVFFLLLLAQLLLVYNLVKLLPNLSSFGAIGIFALYCFFTGLTLSVIFLVYSVEDISSTFFITAGMFGAMSVYGFFTKRDLTNIGQFLIMALFGLILTSVANLVFYNPKTDFVISVLGVLIFSGLTAYDTQRIRETNILGNDGTEEDAKEAIHGALVLYLDFVNLFLKLLRARGGRSRRR